MPEEYSEELVSNQTNYLDPQSYVKANSCPPEYTIQESRDAQSSKNEMLVNKLIADSLSNELILLVDAGDTEILNQDIQTSWPDETMEVRAELLAASPYLSDIVMISAAAKEDVLPNAILTEILVANPQSAKSSNVMNSVDERDTLLYQTQYDQIMAGKLITSSKEELESQLTAAYSKRELAMKNLIMAWYEDTLVTATDSIINLLGNESNINVKYALIDVQLNLNDTSLANNVYNAINTDFELNTNEYIFWQDYYNWLDYRLEQINRGKSITEPDSLQLILLYYLYNTNNQLKATVRNLLRFTDTLNYSEPYLTVDTSMKLSKVKWRPIGNTTSQGELRIYPNPTRNYFVVDFSGLNLDNEELLLEVYGIEGKPINSFTVNAFSSFKVIDTRTWKPGTYVVSLINQGKLLGAKTVLIIR